MMPNRLFFWMVGFMCLVLFITMMGLKNERDLKEECLSMGGTSVEKDGHFLKCLKPLDK